VPIYFRYLLIDLFYTWNINFFNIIVLIIDETTKNHRRDLDARDGTESVSF